MKTSVALACYNGEEFILEQLRSIAEQSRPVDEVVIIDDRSTDKTVEQIQGFLANGCHSHWKLIVNQQNLGYAANFHKAISACTGELVFLCDQDDIWSPNRVEVMAGAMESHPEIGLLNTDSIRLDDMTNYNGATVTECMPQKIPFHPHTFFLMYPGCVMCFRMELYQKYKTILRSDWPHDTFIWDVAMLEDRCYQLPFCSLFRRIHAKQTSGKLAHSFTKRVAFLQTTQMNCEALLNCAKSIHRPEDVQRFYARQATMWQYRLDLVKNKNFWRIFQLLFYLDCYQYKKSFFMEPIIALKGNL